MFFVTFFISQSKINIENSFQLWYIDYKERHSLERMPLRSLTPKGGVSKTGLYPLTQRRPSWCKQGGHFYFLLFLLSRQTSNATIKLPKDISKANIPMKIEIIS